MDNQTNEILENEDSTIFTAPKEKTKKSKKKRKKLGPVKILIILISLLLILGGSIAAIIIYGGNDTSSSSDFDVTTIKILDNQTIDISKINIENINGKLEFCATKVKTDAGDIDSFLLTGYDAELIADSYITSIADKAAKMEALREMSGDGDYGFAKPNATVKITGRNNLENYGFMVGAKSPDGSGYYIKIDNSDKIYLVAASVAEMFLSKPEDLTNNSLILPPNADTVSAEYLTDGVLSYVDKIVISGASHEKTITINHTDNDMAAYKITTPVTRYADLDAVSGYLELITSGITAQGCYKLLPTGADYEKYGLTRPDSLIEISYDKTTVKIVAKKQSDGNYAVVVGNKKAIYTVSSSALVALNYKLSDLLNQFVFLENIEDFKNVTFNDGSKNYSFDITYNANKNTTKVTYGGKEADESLFRTYYGYYLYLKPELQENLVATKTEFTATFNYSDTSKGSIKVEFSKINDRQYLVKIDGKNQGVISYNYFENIKKYLNNVINNEGIPNPS